MDAKEEVRARLNIEDVIGEYVHLKRAGRSFKGLSPFSGEKTPSFFVSPDKNIWHDFSSNKGGDIFAFVMEVEGLDFRGALELLARKAGVELSDYESGASKQLAAAKKRLLEANRLAAAYYQQSLLQNRHAMEYVFKRRKLSKQVVADFQIGYAPDTGSALMNMLLKKGFTKKELSDAGLSNRYGGDLFRGRMMVPLMDPSGQVIGFTGRIIGDAPNAPKYLNTPQTLLYDKGRHIFALSQAKETIRKEEYVVIVEGNLDVVSSHQVGIRQVVATAGTAMTEQHLRAVKRLTGDVRIAYDGDKAGVAATERAIGIAEKEGIELSVVSLTNNAKDPDELIQLSPRLWQQCIDNRKPAVEWVLEQYAKRVDLDSATGKERFIQISYDLLNNLESRTAVRHYGQKIAHMTGFSYEEVLDLVERTDVSRAIVVVDNQTKDNHTPRYFKEKEYVHEDNALAIAAIDPPCQELIGHIDISILHGDARQTLARYLISHAGKPLAETPEELQKYDTYVKIVLLRAEQRYAEWDSNDRYYEMARVLRQIEYEYKKQTQAELTNQLRNAERAGDELRATALRVELNKLIKEIARGKR